MNRPGRDRAKKNMNGWGVSNYENYGNREAKETTRAEQAATDGEL